MRAYESSVRIDPEGRLCLPESVAKLLPAGKAARVIILVPDATDTAEEEAWNLMAREQFLAGYAESDAVYDRI
jgi:hypothetical protein